MLVRPGTTHDGLGDLPLLVVVAAVVLGLGSVAAGLTRPASAPPREVAVVHALQRTALGASSPTPRWAAPARVPLQPTEISPTPPAQSPSIMPKDVASRGVGHDDPLVFLNAMTELLYGRGPLRPADVGRRQSPITADTPTVTTAP